MTTATNVPAVIDQQKDLEHLSVFKQEILSLKEGYKDLKIEGPEDKEGYEKVRLAIASLRTKRTTADEERKSMGKPYRDTVTYINQQYDEVEKLIKDGPGGELALKEMKHQIDDIEKKRDEEHKRLQEEKINNRINSLIKAGMVFDGSYYSISTPDALRSATFNVPETSIGIVQIREMSDELFDNMLQMVTEKNEKIIAEKSRVEALAKKQQEEKEAADKKEREEFEKKKKLLDEQEAKLKQQQDEIKKQEEKIEKEKKEQEQNRINNIIRHRSAILVGMGLEYNEHGESFEYNGDTVILSAPSIADYSDADWLNFIEEIRAVIKKKKDEAEAFLLKKQEEEKQRLELQEKERQAGLSDKEKVKEYITALLSVTVPDCKTKTCKNLVGGVRDYIKDNLPA